MNLLIDADDTLWENNIFFEEVIGAVTRMLTAHDVDPAVFRDYLYETERQHIVTHGYGILKFKRSLLHACRNVTCAEAHASIGDRVEALVEDLLHHPLHLLEGVPETLDYLAGRHALFLVTKGEPSEQMRKVDQSNIKHYFREVAILTEKNVDSYEKLISAHSWDLERTWMIGNSVRSDINPAIRAGMRAVFIPHPHTWVLEHEEPVESPRLIQLERFSDLRKHF